MIVGYARVSTDGQTQMHSKRHCVRLALSKSFPRRLAAV
jgi:DNA invertase Pin-like site-specific DNA recombinase